MMERVYTRWVRWRAAHPAWLRTAAFVFVALAAIYSNIKAFEAADQAHDAIVRSNRESVERRDQICLGAEQVHLNEVNALRDRYRYVLSLRPSERRATLNEFIIAQIPKTEADAKSDEAPDFCDEPGEAAEKRGAKPIGLPEPDPKIPARPKRIDKLIQELAHRTRHNGAH